MTRPRLEQTQTPAVSVGRVFVRPDGLTVLALPATTLGMAKMQVFREIEQAGWVVSLETLFERVTDEDHIGLVPPNTN